MRFRTPLVTTALACLTAAALSPQQLSAQQPQWQIYKVANTGIPGGEVEFAKFDPEGDLWVGATDPFNPSGREGGVAEFDGHVWTNYSNLNSPLLTPWVTDVIFDAEGAAWIGTNAGLFKKKGGQWTRWSSSSTALANNSMGEFSFDPSGALWMLHWDGAVSRFDGTSFRSWTQQEIGFVPSIAVSTLVVDGAGDVWVGTEYAGGFAKLDYATVGPSATWQKYGNGAPHFFEGGDGNIWAIDLDKIYRYSGLQRQRMPDFGVGNHAYSTIKVLPNGTYWLGTFNGAVGFYDGARMNTYLFGGFGAHVYTIDVDAEGHAWFAGKGGVKELDRATGKWTYHNLTTTGLADRGIQHIEWDTENRVWLGTTTGGLSHFDGTAWTGHSPYNGGTPFWPVSGNGIHSGMAAHPDGSMWVGADIEGILRWDGRKWDRMYLGAAIDAVAVAADGSVWAGPDNRGVVRWDGTRWTNFRPPAVCEIRGIVGAPNNDIFVCDRCGLQRWDGSQWHWYKTSTSGIGDDSVNDIDFHPDGSWWIATESGLSHFDGTTWTNYTEANSGVPANFIANVEVAPNGDVWVGGFNGRAFPQYGGVSRFDGTTWTKWNRENAPFEDEQITSLEVDPWGNVWIGSALGAVLVATFGTDPFPGAWTDLGNGLAGTTGVPELSGHGSLTSGTTYSMKLDGALPDSTGVLIVGNAMLGAPLLGGTLVPTPQAILPIATNGGGRYSLIGRWPFSPLTGLQLHAQTWLLDPGAAFGAAASNGIVGRVP